MKKLILGIALLSAALTATAQDMAKKQGESISTYLSLSSSQKQAVIKIYRAEDDQRKQKRDAMIAKHKPSKEALAARDKAAKSKKPKDFPKSSEGNPKIKTTTTPSEIFLRIAYRKAETNPALQEELKEVFTPSQFDKWQELGNK